MSNGVDACIYIRVSTEAQASDIKFDTKNKPEAIYKNNWLKNALNIKKPKDEIIKYDYR